MSRTIRATHRGIFRKPRVIGYRRAAYRNAQHPVRKQNRESTVASRTFDCWDELNVAANAEAKHQQS